MGPLTLAAAACAGLAGLAVFCAVRHPTRQLQRALRTDHPRGTRRPRLGRLLGGRSDAVPLPRRLGLGVLCAVAAGVAGARAGAVPGPLLWSGLPLVAVVVTISLGWLEPLAARRRRQTLVLQAPQALELLAAGLAAGMPVRTAGVAVAAVFDGPVGEDLGRVLAVAALGVSDAEAWRTLREHPQFGAAAVDLARSVESGTMMVESLRHHAGVARERRRAALQVRARSVGVRSVLPLMVCFIPSFMLLGVVPTVVSAIVHALG